MHRYLVTILIVAGLALPAHAKKKRPKKGNSAVAGNTAFALNLYQELRSTKNGNLFYSPYSISTALAMTYAGARGETATEMETVLGFAAKQDIHASFRKLQTQVNGISDNGNVMLHVANSLWPDKKYSFLDSYMDLVKSHYKAKLNPLDFGDAPAAAKAINDWVEDKTNDRIKDILKASDIDPLTKLALVNAIYFKGNWKHQFKKERTRDQDFTVGAGSRIRVPLMSQTGAFELGGNSDLQILELPYAGDEVSMLIVLPHKTDGLPAVEKKLNPKTFANWTALLRPQSKVNVFLPRFKMEDSMQMSDTLSALGMPSAFSRNADFSGMDGSRSLMIDKVIHKAFVEVNEVGTEAAAATVVLMTRKSKPRIATFRADHPFLFFIRDNSSGSILFMGRMADPKS
jgi:serine protease inhibitor